MDLLRTGITPRRLAWSLALGMAVGINPLLGSTTLIALALAWVLRLNLIAAQLATHMMYPIELALFALFLKAGNRFFDTAPMPLNRHQIFEAVRHHPVETTHMLWTWEWHALLVWAACAVVLVPVLATALTPLLCRFLKRLHRHIETA
jgi:uncharacterized protein (DUF2062 family)